jgi:hypothetical protein
VASDTLPVGDRLAEVDVGGAVHRLISIASTTRAYHSRGRYDRAKATEVFGSLVRLIGHGSRWWSNTDGAGGWSPVTRHVFDAVVIGVGGGIVVTILAFDKDRPTAPPTLVFRKRAFLNIDDCASIAEQR